MTPPHLVLLGPGLAHLNVLLRLPREFTVTLVSEGPQQLYRSMLPGVPAQEYTSAADAHVIELRDGRSLPSDVLSINVGATRSA